MKALQVLLALTLVACSASVQAVRDEEAGLSPSEVAQIVREAFSIPNVLARARHVHQQTHDALAVVNTFTDSQITLADGIPVKIVLENDQSTKLPFMILRHIERTDVGVTALIVVEGNTFYDARFTYDGNAQHWQLVEFGFAVI